MDEKDVIKPMSSLVDVGSDKMTYLVNCRLLVIFGAVSRKLGISFSFSIKLLA